MAQYAETASASLTVNKVRLYFEAQGGPALAAKHFSWTNASQLSDWLAFSFFNLRYYFDTRKRHPQPEQKQSTALFAVQGEAVVFEMDCFCNKII